MKVIALTTGDIDGIGCEVAAKALNSVRISRGQRVLVFCNPKSLDIFKMVKKYRTSAVANIDEALLLKGSHPVVLVPSEKSPALWVEEAARRCMRRDFFALVTGPLSKPEIFRAGLKDLGHTDILKRISGRKKLWMSFWGSSFNVVLVTGHIPLREVSVKWNSKEILSCSKATLAFMKNWKPSLSKKKIAYLGLNPHAGDQGLIGNDEKKVSKSLPSAKLVGPLVPDTAFQKSHQSKYAAFLAAYHDQGLIPFKLAHGFDEGVHVTLGLPFLRTSVDHGPAKDLVGTGKAKHGSMRDALQMALDYRPKKK